MHKMHKMIASVLAGLALVATLQAGEANVYLSWQARPAFENVQYYIVSEDLTPGRAILGTTTGTSAVITNVANGAHRYFVSAVNHRGEGIPSGVFAVNVFNYPIASPGIPGGLTGTVQYTWP